MSMSVVRYVNHEIAAAKLHAERCFLSMRTSIESDFLPDANLPPHDLAQQVAAQVKNAMEARQDVLAQRLATSYPDSGLLSNLGRLAKASLLVGGGVVQQVRAIVDIKTTVSSGDELFWIAKRNLGLGIGLGSTLVVIGSLAVKVLRLSVNMFIQIASFPCPGLKAPLNMLGWTLKLPFICSIRLIQTVALVAIAAFSLLLWETHQAHTLYEQHLLPCNSQSNCNISELSRRMWAFFSAVGQQSIIYSIYSIRSELNSNT